jgi:hypothetical protein
MAVGFVAASIAFTTVFYFGAGLGCTGRARVAQLSAVHVAAEETAGITHTHRPGNTIA